MLLGRRSECERIDQLLEHARHGQSGVLLIRGEAGIGKTALCAYATERADAMTVLSARGVETESELPFSGLAELLRPILGGLEEIPAPQASALASAVGIGPSVAGDRFTVCAATLSLLGVAGEEAPLLGIVDDAQWLDRSSAEALLFAARRLEAENVALLLAVRDGHPTLFDRAALPEIRPTSLDHDDAISLLTSRADAPIAPDVAERLVDAAAGNPLALVELPAVLSEPQLAGGEPLAEDLLATAGVERVFSRHVELLPEATRRALLVAAASESGDLDAILEALAALGLEPRALEEAERAALVSVEGGRLQFRHPLLRTAVYQSASGVARRMAHRALAQTAAGDQDVDRRAWHLAAAAPEHDEEASEALEQAAIRAQQRGGHAEAASAFERAALLSTDPSRRARQLRKAAKNAWLVGRVSKAKELVDAAFACVDDPEARARIQHLRGAIEMWHGSPMSAWALLGDEAARVEELDPARAARMLTDAAWAAFMAGEITSGLATAERACLLAGQTGGSAETFANAVLGIGLVLAGETRRAVPLLLRYSELVEAEPATRLYQAFRPDGQVLTWFEEYERGRETLNRTIESARAESALSPLPYALSALTDLDFRTGNWVAAYVGASEAVRIADETDQAATLAFGLVCLARIEAAQGREADCRAHAERARAIADERIGAVRSFCDSTLGLLELGLGHPDAAIANLEDVARRVVQRGLEDPGVIQWTPDLIEAYVRAGRDYEAQGTLEEFERAARKTERSWALATAARCRGLLATEEEFEEEFRRALELHRRTPTPFERARTELCLGERLRRTRQRADAREPLRSALETFERLGADPWTERARAELAASGETARRRDPYAAEQLTAQELQVALVVAQGATNKEAGASLFLSPKTIESHLGRVYRKLNVRSRTELAHLLAREGALAGVAA
jgi:DNA-binding CsgD family transcriptional regulator